MDAEKQKETGFERFETEATGKWSHFSNNLLPAKTTSFFYFGPKYLIMTYLVPFLTDIGLQANQSGLIIGLRYIVQVFGAIILGAIADRSKKYSLITVLSILTSIASVLVMVVLAYFLIPENSPTTSSLTATSNGSFAATGNDTLDKNIVLGDESWKVSIFWISIVCYSVYAFFDGCLNGLVDAVTISICSAFGKKNSYYWQRFWGSVAYSVLPLLAGLILDYWVFKTVSTFMPAIFLFWLGQILLIFPFLLLLKQFNKIKEPLEEKTESKTKWTQVIFHPDIFVCLSLQVLFGIGTGVEFSFLLIYMEKNMINASATVFGMAVFSQCITEALISPVIGKVRKFITDPYLCMSLAVFGYGLAFLCYYFVENAYIIIAVNLLYGVSYPLFNFPAQNECYRICPKDFLATLFSLSASCYTGIGCGLGSVIGGILYDEIGARNTYLLAYGLFQLSCLLVPLYAAYRRYKSKTKDMV